MSIIVVKLGILLKSITPYHTAPCFGGELKGSESIVVGKAGRLSPMPQGK